MTDLGRTSRPGGPSEDGEPEIPDATFVGPGGSRPRGAPVPGSRNAAGDDLGADDGLDATFVPGAPGDEGPDELDVTVAPAHPRTPPIQDPRASSAAIRSTGGGSVGPETVGPGSINPGSVNAGHVNPGTGANQGTSSGRLAGGSRSARSTAPGAPPVPAADAAPLGAGKPELEISGVVLLRELGRGGQGVVYHGKQEFLDREVAVKMLLEGNQDPEYALRFKREAKLLAGMHHPNIVACYQADVTPAGLCFMVMEYVDGPTLGKLIAERGALSVLDALCVCRDVASALQCGHEQHIIHRDVKAENVLLARIEKQERGAAEDASFPYRPKLSDLGLARPQSHDHATRGSLMLTADARVMGTPLYMSPEQFDDPTNVDHRTDIYSLGCLFYEMLVAQPAFREKTLSTLIVAKHRATTGPDPRLERADLDPEVAALVSRMVASERERRPQTYAELIAELERLIARLSGRAPAPPTRPNLEQQGPARSRAPSTAGIAAGVILAVAAGGFGLWWAMRDKPDEQVRPPEPFALAIEAPEAAREGDTVPLRAAPSGNGDALPTLQWEQLEGPRVELAPNGLTASFVAPRRTAPYVLRFLARGEAGGKQAEARPVEVRIDARDDAPRIAVTGSRETRERESVELEATVEDPDNHGALEYRWSLAKGPTAELRPEGAKLRVTAPESDGPYELSIALEVAADTSRWNAEPFVVRVAAVNDAPRVELTGPASVEAGERVVVRAEVSDPDSATKLGTEWRVVSPLGSTAKFADPAARETSFAAPEGVAGDYELGLELRVTDGAAPPTTHALSIRVVSDPALAPLAAGARLPWTPFTFGVGSGHWSQGRPALELAENPNGILAKCAAGEGAITRRLPRGNFVLFARLEPQGLKTESSGLRLEAADGSAACLAFLRRADERRRFVAYRTSANEGVFAPPGPDAIVDLETWPRDPDAEDARIELEIRAEGAAGERLSVRWRTPGDAQWSAPSALPLTQRPRAAALFVNGGLMLVEELTLSAP